MYIELYDTAPLSSTEQHANVWHAQSNPHVRGEKGDVLLPGIQFCTNIHIVKRKN